MDDQTIVDNTWALIERVLDQHFSKRTSTISEKERCHKEFTNVVEVIKNAIKKVPANVSAPFNRVLDKFIDHLKESNLCDRIRERQIHENKEFAEQKRIIEKDFPRHTEIEFVNLNVYADDVVLELSEPLPGAHFRFRQGIVSFFQQVERFCLLPEPNEYGHHYPPEIISGRYVKTRHPYSRFFFNEEFSVYDEAILYACSFVMEMNKWGPAFFKPYLPLPLVTPSDAELYASLKGHEKKYADVD